MDSKEALFEVLDKIESNCMVPDWDSYDAKPVLRDSLTLVCMLINKGCVPNDVNIFPRADGCIQLEISKQGKMKHNLIITVGAVEEG